MSFRVAFSNGIIVDDIDLPTNNLFPAGPKAWKAALKQIAIDRSKEVLEGEVFEVKKGSDNIERYIRFVGKYKTRRSIK